MYDRLTAMRCPQRLSELTVAPSTAVGAHRWRCAPRQSSEQCSIAVLWSNTIVHCTYRAVVDAGFQCTAGAALRAAVS